MHPRHWSSWWRSIRYEYWLKKGARELGRQMRLTLSDSDLHNEDGTHRSTPPAGSGIMPELFKHRPPRLDE